MLLKDPKTETLACLVIDDPLLKPKYGYLDYVSLLQEMREHKFFTEIAFIPWNYRRSDPETVRLFLENMDYLSICVHGCNHVGNEFGGRNYQELVALSSTALWRMEQHKKITGLPYDPVMVFPQGYFSLTAIQALKDRGFFAAFNSTLRAVGESDPPEIEYQHPATMIYHNFPVFLRRYPKDKALFSQDVQNGRPIIIVEHHRAFQKGFKMITDLVDEINGLGNIRWTSLSNIAEYYLGKKTPAYEEGTDLSSSHLLYQSRVALRRILCEVRDNYIDKSELLTKAYDKLRHRAS